MSSVGRRAGQATGHDPAFLGGPAADWDSRSVLRCVAPSDMSKTAAVKYRERTFWAYDESLSILLYLLAERADADPGSPFPPDLVEQGRVASVLGGDVGLDVTVTLQEPVVEAFLRLLDE